MALPRKLTAQEKINFKNDFPKLDVDFTIVTDEPSGIYNCISWTVGVTDYWHWPGSLLSDFDNFYSLFGLKRKTKGHVAAWGFSDSSMTHGCISGKGHGPCWESKCGSWARIQHCLIELDGPAYGHVIAYYAWKRGIFTVPGLPPYLVNYMRQKRVYTKEELNLIKAMIAEIPAETRQAFRIRFGAWKATWFKGAMSSSSNPYARAESPQYRELTAMGKVIIPLLVNEMMKEANFLVLPAFEKLAPKQFIIPIDSSSERVLEGEQGRAFRTVKNFLSKR